MELHDIQVTVPFYLGGQQDVHKPTQILADIGANGFNLPDRDYYLKPDDRFEEARTKYIDHIAKMFTLGGMGCEIVGRGGADHHGDGNKVRGSVALDHVVARSQRHGSQFDLRAIAGPGAAF